MADNAIQSNLNGEQVDPAETVKNGSTVKGEAEKASYNEFTRVNSMAHLSEVAPDLHKSMMKSLMSNMVTQMERFRKNLKRAMRGAYK